jgi:hypothetical protein
MGKALYDEVHTHRKDGFMTQAAAAPSQSADPMVKKLSFFVEEDLKARQEGFCIQNEPLGIDEIASHDGLLSLFMFKASILAEEGLQKRLPLHFESDKSALIDVIPVTDTGDMNLYSLWVHFLSYSVEEEIRRHKKEKKLQNGLVPLDDLYKQWHAAVTSHKFLIKSSSRPQPSAGQNA